MKGALKPTGAERAHVLRLTEPRSAGWRLLAALLIQMFGLVAARGDGAQGRPATQTEVNTGTATWPWVSPATLQGWSGGGGGGGLTNGNLLMSAPTGGNIFNDMLGAHPATTNQLGISSASPSQAALWIANNSGGGGTNTYGGPINFLGGISYIGNPFAGLDLPLSGYNSVGLYWGMGSNAASVATSWASGKMGVGGSTQPYLTLNNGNPWAAGTGINLRSAYTNSSHGVLTTISYDGTNWHNTYMPTFGAEFLDENDAYYPTGTPLSHESQDSPSHNFLGSDATIDWYFSENAQRSGDAVEGQIPEFVVATSPSGTSDPQVGAPLQITNVWMLRNPSWQWAFVVDEASGVTTNLSLVIRSNLVVGNQNFFGGSPQGSVYGLEIYTNTVNTISTGGGIVLGRNGGNYDMAEGNVNGWGDAYIMASNTPTQFLVANNASVNNVIPFLTTGNFSTAFQYDPRINNFQNIGTFSNTGSMYVGGTYNGNGNGLTNLNAANLTGVLSGSVTFSNGIVTLGTNWFPPNVSIAVTNATVTNQLSFGTGGTTNTGGIFNAAGGLSAQSLSVSTKLTYVNIAYGLGIGGNSLTYPTDDSLWVTNNGVASIVRSNAVITSFVATTGTNAFYAVATTGFTNTTGYDVIVRGFTGTSVFESNLVSTVNFSRGTIGTATDILLNTNQCLVGTSCAALKIETL